ncbi:hypothetical protein ACFL2Q_08820 [Thermodesulfobacteriota bacterium]
MAVRSLLAVFLAAVVCAFIQPPVEAQTKKQQADSANQLVGRWQIFKTKEPGKPYLTKYKGRPFVAKGPHSFTVIMEYRKDGSFRRISRKRGREVVEEGRWALDGHELRQKVDGRPEEILYFRLDSPDRYTLIEVYEDTPDPGLFAQFRRLE